MSEIVSPKSPAIPWAGGAMLLLFCACVAIVVLRRPDAVMNPQFWAEDGKIWFANAHDLGAWHSLLLAQNGYLQTISRLAAALAMLFPMRHAPLVFNLAAIVVQVLPVMLLNGARGRALVPSLPARAVLSLLYIAQPYTAEVHANLTNAQWHLAVSAALILCFDGWRSQWQAGADIALVALSGMSGPFCIVLAPIAAWLAYRRRDRRTLLLAALLVGLAILQLSFAIPQMGVSRAVAPLGVTWQGFFRIAGGQVVLAGLLGDAWAHLYPLPLWKEGIVMPLAATLGGAIVFVRAARVGSQAAACFMLFCVMVFAAALWSPQLSAAAQWPIWETPHAGERYSFLPILGLYVALLVLATQDKARDVRRLAAGALAVACLVAIPASWTLPPFRDYAYQDHVDAYLRAKSGDSVRIPLNPPGWFMELRKPVDADKPPD